MFGLWFGAAWGGFGFCVVFDFEFFWLLVLVWSVVERTNFSCVHQSSFFSHVALFWMYKDTLDNVSFFVQGILSCGIFLIHQFDHLIQ